MSPKEHSLEISVIVPVHDGERYLAETLDSILAQTLRPLEILVVDDGSTDGTAAIAKSFGDPVVYVHRERAGVSAARNHGIRIACGDLIAFLDADDLFLPHKLELQRQRFIERPELDMSSGYTANFWSPEMSALEADHDPKPTEPWPRFIGTWVVRRSVFDTVGGFDESMRLSQDVDWNIRVERSPAVTETLDEVLTRRRLHRGNTTRQARSECRRAVLGSVRAHLETMRGREGRGG